MKIVAFIVYEKLILKITK